MEYEVISFEYSIKDMHYVTEVIPFCSNVLVTMTIKEQEIRIVRLPYKPRLGQIIKLKAI